MLGTLRDSFAGNVHRWPTRMAVIAEQRSYTYGELNACVNQFANFLTALGVKKGAPVGCLLKNCAEFAIGFLACQKLGAASSGLNYRLSAGALGYTVQQERLRAVLFNSIYSDKIVEIIKDADFCRFIGVGNLLPAGPPHFRGS